MFRPFKLLCFIFFFSNLAIGQINVDEYYQPEDGEDWSIAINRAISELEKAGHGSVEFTGNKTYKIEKSIQLPRESTIGKRLIILEGNGCVISCKKSIAIFSRKASDQKSALNKMMSTRFYINDFTLKGGAIGIELDASYGSKIAGCIFLGQKIAAVQIQFGLNTVISHCHSNGAWKDNFVLSTGQEWGGTDNNSQSNHSIIESCRVFARDGSNSAFKILGSGGCVIRDCISEGDNSINYAIYIDNLESNTVRLNRIENFHLEHKPLVSAIYINSKGITTIDGLFYQKAFDGFLLIEAGWKTEQLTLMNVPHYVEGSKIQQNKTGNGTAWKLIHCHKKFNVISNWKIKNTKGSYDTAFPLVYSFEGYYNQLNKFD